MRQEEGLKGAIEYIAELARGAAPKVEKVEFDGHEYLFVDGRVVDPRQRDPQPETLVVHTLTGFVDYVREMADDFKGQKVAVHVESPTIVELVSTVQGHFKQRHVFARAVAHEPLDAGRFRFGMFVHPESMVIALRTLFQEDDEVRSLLELVGGLRVEDTSTLRDNGISQEVAYRKGVATMQTTEVRRFTLAPFRTFTEVAQPTSPFLLRLKADDGFKVALFECDGGQWMGEAIARVAEYLRAHVTLPVIA